MQSSCSFANVNLNNWIGITALVLLAMMSIGALIYAFATILPNPLRDKLKRMVHVEYSEGAFSLLLLVCLISLAYAACSVGASLSNVGGNYQNIFQSDNYYIGTLLFSTGTKITSELISQGILLSIDANMVNFVLYSISKSINTGGFKGTVSGHPLAVSINYSGSLSNVYASYSNTYAVYSGFIVITFGALFILYFLFPIISTLGLGLIIPIAIVMRTISFVGPKLREASNAFIALGVALYFVLPLAVAANQSIVNWVYCSGATTTTCNPYIVYLGPYKLNNIPTASFLNKNTTPFGNIGGVSLSIPASFFGATVSGSGSFVSFLQNLAEGLVLLPNQVNNYTAQVAQYVFEGIVLIALDFAITMGFAQGLYKGLNAIPGILGGGQAFWSD